MSNEFKPLLSLLVLPLMGVIACEAPAAVTVNPETGKVFVSRDNKLYACDQSVEGCVPSTLGFKPLDAAVDPAGGIVMIDGSILYRCNEVGQACGETRLPKKIGKAVGVSVAETGQVVVVGTKQVAVCQDSGCTPKLPEAPAKPNPE